MNRSVVVLMLVIGSQFLAGCSHFVSKAANSFGDNLSSAILNQDDPELVRAGMPSYILLMDSFLQDEEKDPAMLASAATLYASYGGVFAEEPARAQRLTRRGREYASQAMCQSVAESCTWRDIPYDEFVASLARVEPKHADLLYTYGFTSLAYIRAHSDDWNALAELPQAEAVMQHYIDISGETTQASAHNYIGILMTVRPPSLGGKQEEARLHFNIAIALSDGKDLGPKLEMLKGIARMLYDRELNDQLCEEILSASPYADGYTLTNVMAQEEALALCSEADDYF
jgi:hypothetical protein